MKELLIILSSILSGSLLCQNLPGEYYKFKSMELFYVYENDTISGEFIDTNIAEGNLTQFKRLVYEGYDNNKIIIPGKRIHKKIQLCKLVEGQYKQGKRWGQWKISNKRDTMCSGYAEYIHYKQDTVIVGLSAARRFYVNDSNIVYGTIFPNDTRVDYRCNKESGCNYWVGSPKNQITSSHYDDLEWTLWLFRMGEFDEKLKERNPTTNPK